MARKLIRLIETDEGLMNWCAHEKEYRPIELFIQRGEKYHYTCNECIEKIYKHKKHVTVDIRGEAMNVLEKLGYDTRSNETINSQFLKRHKL
jgi:hypothetical protein